MDATYVFPMSSNAAVYDMQMQINQKIIQAEIKEKDQAQEIFNAANENSNTATQLEQQRPNVFQMSLANINLDVPIVIKMKYTELLGPEKSKYRFAFPTVVYQLHTVGGEK